MLQSVKIVVCNFTWWRDFSCL